MEETVLYTLSTCPWCRKAKNYFSEHHVKFRFIDYDLADMPTQERIIQEMDRHRASAFPFALINGDAVEGYNPGRYAILLGI